MDGTGGRRDGFRSLPSGAQRYLAATLVTMIGNGMNFAFLFIYFNEVRRFSGAWSGTIISVGGFVTLATTSLGGLLTDRHGAKTALLWANAFSAIVFGLYTFSTTIALALGVSLLTGFAQGLAIPSQNAFASTIVDPLHRPLISSWMRIAVNIGAAFGGTIAGFLVHVSDPGSFSRMFVLNAATYVFYLMIVRGIPTVAVTGTEAAPIAETAGYREVRRDRFFVRLLPLDLAVGAMFGLAFMVMPTTFVKRIGGTERAVGFVFMAGAVAVILTQIAVARVVHRRPRLLALAVMFGLFAIAFACAVASVGQPLTVALTLVVAAQWSGGLAESFLGPTRNPLTADLAPGPLLGRYFGLQSMMFQAGFSLSIGIGGAGLDHSLRGTWAIGIAAAIAAAAWAVRLDRIVPAAVRLCP